MPGSGGRQSASEVRSRSQCRDRPKSGRPRRDRSTHDQFTFRFDHKINDHQNFTAYYYFNDNRELDPYDTFEAAGANTTGFGNLNNLRYQQWNFTHTWTINNAIVNEAHFTYMREGQLGYIKPQTTGVLTSTCSGAAAQFCFTGTSDSSAITQ